jgi:hypothetical protein
VIRLTLSACFSPGICCSEVQVAYGFLTSGGVRRDVPASRAASAAAFEAESSKYRRTRY